MTSKMKFLVKSVGKCAPRLGVLKGTESLQRLTIETPFAMLYTRGGSIPHITHEVFQICCNEPQIIQIPVVSTYQFYETMEEYPGNISEFVGMKSCISCITVQDPGDLTQPGHHYKDHMPLWTRAGKILINSDKYMDIIETFKPNMYYLLSDGDTNIASSQKRVTKAVDNTVRFVNRCLERHKSSDVLKNTFVMAPVTGGYCLKSRKRCLEEIGTADVIDGYLIDGLHNNGPEVEFIPFKEIKEVVKLVANEAPSDKLLAVHGCWNPVNIVKMVQLGIDVFDTSYCYIVTERSSALTFAFDRSTRSEIYEINLRHIQYADDFRPILPGCQCFTCTKHSRGYIYHLVVVQELLGSLLLTIHNIHHFMKFFERIRSCIAAGTLVELEKVVSEQFDKYQEDVMRGRNTVVTNAN